MITKREKLQYGYLFLIDLLSLVLSIGLAWGLTAGVLHKMGDFQLDDLVEACFLLLLAYILTFFTFDQSENIVNRTPIREVEIAVRFNFLLTLIDAACLALTKAPMLHSRYFLVFVPVIDVFVMTGAHAVLKKMLVRSRYTKGIQSLVGVVTTQENASPVLEELKKDWSKRVTGLAILEAAPEQLHTEIDGVKIEANFDNFMDWLRQAALDEVYLDVAQESEENMLPYLEEMESMGLTVHFRLPVLDRIEKACCDETSAVRISRELSRCAGGNVVTMGTVELKLRDQVLKRTMDIVGGIVGCIISIPIIALVAIPLKLESPGPLIFKQRRVGRNGRVFYIHKLRSMYVDAEARKKELMAQNEMNGLMFKMEDDPRITRVCGAYQPGTEPLCGRQCCDDGHGGTQAAGSGAETDHGYRRRHRGVHHQHPHHCVGGHPAQAGKPRPADLQAAPGGPEWTCVLHPQAAQHVCGCGSTQKGTDGPERNERPDVQDGR